MDNCMFGWCNSVGYETDEMGLKCKGHYEEHKKPKRTWCKWTSPSEYIWTCNKSAYAVQGEIMCEDHMKRGN